MSTVQHIVADGSAIGTQMHACVDAVINELTADQFDAAHTMPAQNAAYCCVLLVESSLYLWGMASWGTLCRGQGLSWYSAKAVKSDAVRGHTCEEWHVGVPSAGARALKGAL